MGGEFEGERGWSQGCYIMLETVLIQTFRML